MAYVVKMSSVIFNNKGYPQPPPDERSRRKGKRDRKLSETFLKHMYISGVFDRMQKDGLRVIDLRSDTVTKPTKEMRD